MIRVCGIDSSTRKTGISLFVNGKFKQVELIDLSKDKSSTDERINTMGNEILKILGTFKPEIVYIETPRGDGRNVELVRKLSEILGIVRAWTIQHDAYYEEVLPSSWRKYIGIEQGKKKRAELKQESINYVKEAFGLTVNDDEADSICIANAMLRKYGGKD